MGGDKNSIPLTEADSLEDMAELRHRLSLGLSIINQIDPEWPHKQGTNECRYCGAVMPSHNNSKCPAKLFLGV